MEEPELASSPALIARNTVVRAGGEVVAKAASLAFFVVLARRLGSEGYGTFSFALALTGTLLTLAGFGTDQLVAREVARDPARAGRELADAAALKGWTSAALLAVALVIVIVGGYPADAILTTLLVGLGVLFETLAKSWHAIFQAFERLELISLSLIVQRGLTAAAGIAVLLAGGGVVGAAAAFAGGGLAGLAVAELALRRRLPLRRAAPERSGAQRMLLAGVPIGIATVLLTLLLRLDVTLLSFLAGTREVGEYAAAYRLVEACQFLSWAFGGAVLPWLARGRGQLPRGLNLGLKLEAAMLVPLALVFTCFAGPIVRLVYGAGFAGSDTPLRLLGPTTVSYGLLSFASVVLIARYAPGALTRVTALVVVQNLACNFVAIPLAGADGAAAVALSSSGLLAILAMRQASRLAGPLRAVRAFSGPLAAGAAMAAVVLAVPLPAVPAGLLGATAYVAVLLAVELSLHRDDARAIARALPGPLAIRFAARP